MLDQSQAHAPSEGDAGDMLHLGDSSARLDTRGDLVLGGVGDAGKYAKQQRDASAA